MLDNKIDKALLNNDFSSQLHRVETVLVIGLGMIGGSLAKALKENAFSKRVIGYDRQQESVDLALKLGVIDIGYQDINEAVSVSDLIILAVPVKATVQVLTIIKPFLKESVLISDVGSTKASVICAAKEVFGQVPSFFIPAHPIAGSEKSGVQASNSELFVKHKVIITPHDNACDKAVTTIGRMWQSTGAEVLQMDVEKHDDVLAATSHLPHILAFSLVDTLAKESASLDIFRYAAGGFRDFTRIAASDPTMWNDVCLANKDAILQQIDMFSKGLEHLKDAIDKGDEKKLKSIFIRARSAREHFGRMLEGTAYSKNSSENSDITFYVEPSASIEGEVSIPGDKSISHRAIIFAALADGVSEITGFLNSEDSMATVQAFRDMGVVIESPHNGKIKVYGVGKYGLCPPTNMLYLGNSGTSMRLLAGLLAAQSFDSVLVGDDSLNSRPMERVAIPLRAMGADISTSDSGCAPIYIKGGKKLTAINYQMPMASSQVKSSILLASCYADQASSVRQPEQTRDHTELLMKALGINIGINEESISVDPQSAFPSFNLDIPKDFSSAAFFIVGAAISPDSKVILKGIGVNPTRVGLIHILRLMGADIKLINIRENKGEEVADIVVQYSPLSGIEIPQKYVSIAIDEFPAIFIAASCAQGQTIINGLQELRFKESDRITVMSQGLRTIGIKVVEHEDGVIIDGGDIQGGCIDSHGDHRIAMAFAMAGLRSKKEIKITNCANVASSFPEFVAKAAKAGLRIRKEETNVS